MANDFLIAKWKLWYKAHDVNHDGKISIEDVEESRKKFSELSKLDAEVAKKTEERLTNWWNTYIFRGKNGEISETEFVDALNKDFSANKAKFTKEMTSCFETIFSVIDTNKDRSISKDEFLAAFKSCGHENDALETELFETFSPKDGLVPLTVIVKALVDFVTSEDASKGSVIKTAFESGV